MDTPTARRTWEFREPGIQQPLYKKWDCSAHGEDVPTLQIHIGNKVTYYCIACWDNFLNQNLPALTEHK